MFKRAFCFSLLAVGLAAQAAPTAKKSAPPTRAEENPVSRARNFYAAGQFKEAAKAYENLPMSSPEYLRTREELAWSYLQAEDWVKLRGILADVNSELVPLRWRLEGRVLSAMLHLKDCQYEKVKEEIATFQNEMAPLAKTIDQKLSGPKNQAYWTALQEEVREAMFKMKFVRMELRSRLVMLSREQVIDTPERKDAPEKISAKMQVFPVNEDVWADEVFEKRGEGQSICTAIHKAKVMR